MFIPIKIFLLLASDFNVPTLLDGSVTKNQYITLLITATAILYVFNTSIQVYFSRLQNEQIKKLESEELEINNTDRRIIQKNLKPTYRYLADIMTILVSLFVFTLISPYYAIVFVSTVLLYAIFVEYVAFTDNKFDLLESIKIDSTQVIDVSSSLLYLFLLVSLFLVYSINPIPTHSAILLLFGSRLVNASIRNWLLNSQKLFESHKKYKGWES
ncbi:hypothetical protein AB4138_15840 [Vibrio sp. 10N.286.52.C3]|uniref:hypothetical protein n=1 Tax=Vibrio sp. 10N.286.52.C3 TaxID=3229713 RepID=UPI00354FBC38